jgi:hypothetical protein
MLESPNSTFTQLLKKKVGPRRYKNGIRKIHKNGKRSNKKLKKSTSAIKKILPGNPKKTKQFSKLIKKSLGQVKLIPLISVTKRVLKRLLIASTKKKEFDDNRAWLINIQKLANIRDEYPLKTQMASQCISTTVE